MSARLSAAAFGLLCLVGAVSAVGLTVREALRTPAVVMEVAGTTRTGLTTTVTVSVRNTTGRSRCAGIRVAARDRAGHDLGAVTAARSVQLAPHASVRVSARVTLSARQYAERLYGFYPSERPCGRPGGPA